MYKLTVKRDNKEKIIRANEKENLLTVLRKNGIFVNADCGGYGLCGKCKVIDNGLEVLSCRVEINRDMVIEVPIADFEDFNDEILINKEDIYALALDLGTTTVVGYLIDLVTKETLFSRSIMNPQITYGADIVSRISACDNGNLKKLNELIINTINEMIESFSFKKPIDLMVVSGNLTMLHLLTNTNPTTIGRSPFTPVFLKKEKFQGQDIKVNAKEVILLPAISSYIGADIVAGCLYIDLLKEKRNVFLIDLGTNGEMVLKAREKYYATSTAAGPAFEGRNIEWGLGGVKGAISHVKLVNNKLEILTISGKPLGICGSGLVDLISILLDQGIIDETGLLNRSGKSVLNYRLQDDKFYLTENIYLSQKDIREFQLAKSAIYSGMMMLLKKAGINIDEIDVIYLAGGFGFYLNKVSAIKTGIIPDLPLNKIKVIGNSSGLGSIMVAKDLNYLKQCDVITDKFEVVGLENKEFNDFFIENINFKQERERK